MEANFLVYFYFKMLNVEKKVSKKIKKDKKVSKKETLQKIESLKTKVSPVHQNRHRQQEIMYQKTLNELIAKEEQDKTMIMKYAKSQYKPEILQQAMDGRLEQSASLMFALKQHYNSNQIRDV